MASEEAIRRAEEILRNLDMGDWTVLVDDVADDLSEVFTEGMVEGLRLTDVDVPTDDVNARAVEWAKERAASLVTQIEENTRDKLRAELVDALEERQGARELADTIAASDGFSDERAAMIARTEISAAHNGGALGGYKAAAETGVRVMKEWLDADADDECADNAADGPIELDDEFSSGDDAPPAHPNCRCSITPYLPDEDEGEEGQDEAEAA